jgi:hypothetical protein
MFRRKALHATDGPRMGDAPNRVEPPRRHPKWRWIARAAGFLAMLLVGMELSYLLVTNALLVSGLIQRAANTDQNTRLGWRSAYSPWPGRVYVSDFSLILQDPMIQFQLGIDRAKVDVVLWELLEKRFRARHVHAQGVRYRFVGKVESVAGKEERVSAFPPIAGFTRPALRQNPMPPPATEADRDALWSAQLDDVDATISELWFTEFRYRGAGRVQGAFFLEPLRKLWVGPTRLRLDGGKLEVGDHLISSSFAAQAKVAIAPVDLPSSPGLRVLHTLDASIHCESSIEDLGAADLYLAGLRAEGAARVVAELQIADAKLMPGSSLDARLTGTRVAFQGYQFTGDAHAQITVPGEVRAPTVNAALTGTVRVPVPGREPVVAAISGLTVELVFANNDLLREMPLDRLHAVLGEARVRDARAVTEAAGAAVPVLAPLVLGQGPLVVSATAHVTPDYKLIRIKSLTLGNGELAGAAISGPGGWNGAAAGHFADVPIGLQLRNNKIQVTPFTSSAWLGAELLKEGITSR